MKPLQALFANRRLLTTLAAGAAFTYVEHENYQQTKPFYQTKPFFNPDIQLKAKHTNMIFTQAYRDMGYNGPIHIKYNDEGHTGTFSAFDKNYKYATFVDIDKELLKNPNYAQLYAVAGREATHTTSHHPEILRFMTSLSIFLPLIFITTPKVLYFAAMIVGTNLARAQVAIMAEKDADITSAKTLGTAAELISYLGEDPKIPYQNIIREYKIQFCFGEHEITLDVNRSTDALIRGIFGDTKPHVVTRVDYLKLLYKSAGRTPLLFKSEAWHTILSERQEETTLNDEPKSLAP